MQTDKAAAPAAPIGTPDTASPAHELARNVGAAMFAVDHGSRDFMQMELIRCAPGQACMRMTVRAEMVNGHGTCHGGFIFTLADSAFAYACNSHNKAAVAAGCSIEYLRPAHPGDVLTCSGQEQALQGRHGIYDMRVENQRGEVVAMFRGKSTQIAGTVLPDSATGAAPTVR